MLYAKPTGLQVCLALPTPHASSVCPLMESRSGTCAIFERHINNSCAACQHTHARRFSGQKLAWVLDNVLDNALGRSRQYLVGHSRAREHRPGAAHRTAGGRSLAEERQGAHTWVEDRPAVQEPGSARPSHAMTGQSRPSCYLGSVCSTALL